MLPARVASPCRPPGRCKLAGMMNHDGDDLTTKAKAKLGRDKFIRAIEYAIAEGSPLPESTLNHHLQEGQWGRLTPAEAEDIFVVRPATVGHTYILRPQALFFYIDYLKLDEARKASADAQANARSATRLAMFALIVSAVLAVASIGVSIWSIGIAAWRAVTPSPVRIVSPTGAAAVADPAPPTPAAAPVANRLHPAPESSPEPDPVSPSPAPTPSQNATTPPTPGSGGQ